MVGRLPILLIVALPTVSSVAFGRTFGTDPIPISTGPSGNGANAPSGAASISGDDRTARYAAFHSFASNLVPGDTNGVPDVFVYSRPPGGRGMTGLDRQRARPAGRLLRASVARSGGQANGASANPSLDGSVQRAPRCVAFQSQATNLVPGDRDRDWDVYVRDLRAGTTRLMSAGVSGSAVDPAISGDCRQVAFTSAGRIYVGNGLKGGRAHLIARGTNPDLSLDGSAITWERGHGVWLRRKGRTTRVAAVGGNPHVSDGGSSATWAVAFDTPSPLAGGDRGGGSDVYMRTFKARGDVRRTTLISARGGRSLGGDSHNGGITAYAQARGIVVFANTAGADTTLWYMNLHSGNIDDLAHGRSADPSRPAIFDVATSARANYVAFSSLDSFKFDGNGQTQDVYEKYLGQK
jgi:hypothetical protein